MEADLEAVLFHPDNDKLFDMDRLRKLARLEVTTSSLIQRCVMGDHAAAVALHRGFWEFVYRFEQAIDSQANSSKLPREPLYEKFTRATTRKVTLSTAKTLKRLTVDEVNGVFGSLEAAVKEMQHEEFTHSAHWAMDAQNLGITEADLKAISGIGGVQALVESAYTKDLVEFFGVLAGTEFIAEELGVVLSPAPLFRQLFQRGRWIWGEVHTIPHDGGPSHLDIDMDLARAYCMSDDPRAVIEKHVERTIKMFGAAARDVELFLAPMAIAAE